MLVAVGIVVLIMFTMWWKNDERERDKIIGDNGSGNQGVVEIVRQFEPSFLDDNDRPALISPEESLEAAKKIKEEFQSQLSKLDDPALQASMQDVNPIGEGNKGTPGFNEKDPRETTKKEKNNPQNANPHCWEIQFYKTSLITYARQLDFFRIELAVLYPDGRVAYITNLSDTKPTVRIVSNPGNKETRFCLSWRRGELKKADEELLARANEAFDKGIVIKFLSFQLEAQLEELEKAHAGSETRPVEKTRFGIKPVDNGFAFYVLEQTYKNTPAPRT